jgi:ribosome-associated protein
MRSVPAVLQGMNKVATGVQLRMNIADSPSLPDEVKQRLYILVRNRITEEGVLIIEAKRFRTQEQNREDAIARLVAILFQATQVPKARRKTRPSLTAKAERIDEKKRRGAVKRLRRPSPTDLD